MKAFKFLMVLAVMVSAFTFSGQAQDKKKKVLRRQNSAYIFTAMMRRRRQRL